MDPPCIKRCLRKRRLLGGAGASSAVRAAYRFTLWAAGYVALLLLVPAAFPPPVDPSFDTPVWSAGNLWEYGTASTYEGLRTLGGEVLINTTAVGKLGPASNLTASISYRGLGPAGVDWPLAGSSILLSDGDWTGLEWTCGTGRSWANFSAGVPVGYAFPLTGPQLVNSTASATVAGSCTAPGAASIVSEGGMQVVDSGGGSAGCTLYVCNQLRLYPFRDELSIGPPGGGAPWVDWTLRGTFDPTVSGYRYLSISPGLTDGFENRSVNLTLGNSADVGDLASPSPATMYGESALLVFLWPVAVLLLEVQRLRRLTRQADEEGEAAVLAALSEEEREGVEPDLLVEEEVGTTGREL